MSVCKPIYPSKRRFSRIPDLNNFNLAESNPILRFNQRQITVLNVLNNALLINANLDNYPFLKQRFDQSPITDEEFAGFLFTQGLTPTTVEDAYLNDFPVPIDIQLIRNFVDVVDQAIEDAIYDLVPDIPLADEPVTITPAPFVDDETPVDRFIPGTGSNPNWTPGTDVDNILNQLDDYYENNFATPISDTNLCSNLSNPFAKLASLIANASAFINSAAGLLEAGNALLGSAQDLLGGLKSKVDKLVSDIKNFSIANLVQGLVARLDSLKTEMLSLVDNLKEKMLSKIENLKATALQFIDQVKSSAKRLFSTINKKIQQAKNFFQDFNINKIKNKIESVVKLGTDQFEDLLPAVMNMLILGACGMSNAISAFMQKPVDDLKGFLDKLTLGYNVAETFSVLNTDFAIAAGAIRVDPILRETERRSGAEAHNRSQPAQIRQGGGGGTPQTNGPRTAPTTATNINPGNYVTLEMSAEERQFVADLTEDGNEWFVFADSVKNMGSIATSQWNSTRRGAAEWDPNENYPEAGWKVVAERNPFIWAALKRVATKLQDIDGVLDGPLRINSAFRSRWYNRIYQRQILGNRGAAVNSMHMAAMAIDISTRNLTNEGTAKLVQRLSEEGFSRMSVYNTFVHADIKDMGTYRGNWTGNYRGSSAIRRAMEIHLADGFRSGTQRVIPQEEGGTVSAETETTPNELAQVDSPDSPAATDTQDTDTTTRENTSDTPGEVQANPQQTENARLLLEQREQQRAEQAAAAAAAAANAPATENGVDLGITQAEYRALSGRERYELRKRTPGTNAYERALRGNAP